MARILIITNKQPSTNPRMRKSADALAKAGYTVHVLYAYNSKWAMHADREILDSAEWTARMLGGNPLESKFKYAFSRFIRKIFERLQNFDKTIIRSKWEYLDRGRVWRPDLVIGHNLGSLSVIADISQALGIPALFDAEDFHRGEVYWVEQGKEKQVECYENTFIPQLTGVTAASPLIALEYSKLYPEIEAVPVNNAFPASKTKKPSAQTGPIKIVWFSQVTGLGRGLQEFINGMNFVPNIPIHLEIIGQANEEIISSLSGLKDSQNHQIVFTAPMPESKLLEYLTTFEIGLTLEIPVPKSRNICRANKLYTYPIAGCFMFISRTKGQIEFLEEWPCTGRLVDLNEPRSIGEAITWAQTNRSQLLEKRIDAWELAQKELNWENESRYLVDTVNRALNIKNFPESA